MTFPRSAGHTIEYYNHKNTHYFRKYRHGETGPLYTFGHGLSYTSFAYSNLKVPSEVKMGDDIEVTVDITNTGKRAGTEIALMYVNDVVSSVTTPVKELKGFQRVALAAGETKTVAFTLKQSELQIWNRQEEWVVEPGEFEIMLGDQKTSFELNSPNSSGKRKKRGQVDIGADGWQEFKKRSKKAD